MPLLPLDEAIHVYRTLRPDETKLHELENQVLRRINAGNASSLANWLEHLFAPQHRWASATAMVAMSFLSASMMLGASNSAAGHTVQALSLNVFSPEYATPLYPILK